jgi:HlyD family secretion protein
MIQQTQPSTNFRKPAIIGLSMIIILFGGGILWSYFAQISGAVIAQGAITIAGKPKTIQHADSGVVKFIYIEAGDRVKKGDILIELDSTTIAANLAIYRTRLRDAIVRKSRLLAELERKAGFEGPNLTDTDLFKLGDSQDAIKQQKILMEARLQTRDGEISQYDDKLLQIENQITGTKGLREQKLLQIGVYVKERSSINSLIQKNIVAKNQLLTFDRAMSDLKGQVAEQDSEIARLENSISETKSARAQVDKQLREKVITEIEDTESKIDEMKQQILATDLQMQRTSIRAPIDGVIHELAMHTIGGVVQPGQAIMQIIPVGDDLEIEVHADPRFVDEITTNRQAMVKFPSFHQRNMPEIFGSVIQISPSSIVDERTGASFYRVKISIPKSEKLKLGKHELIPGMPVEAVMPTVDRTVLSYLVKPLMDQMQHAMREE